MESDSDHLLILACKHQGTDMQEENREHPQLGKRKKLLPNKTQQQWK